MKISYFVLIAIITALCNCALSTKAVKPYCESDDYKLSRNILFYLANSNSTEAFCVFSKTVSLESISPYFSFNDFFILFPNKQVINNFVKNNTSSINLPFDAFQPFARVIEDTLYDIKTIKTKFPPQINFKTMDTLKTVFIRMSQPGYNSRKDTALVLLEFYCHDWDYGTICVYARPSGYWVLVKQRFIWTNEKKPVRDTTDPTYSAQTAFFDTIPEGLADKFQTSFVISNIEEDTIMYRSQEELYNQSLSILDTIHNYYRQIYKKPRPKGAICFNYYINCAGQIYNFQVSCDEIGNDLLLNKSIELFNTLRYPDKVRTNRCGKVKVDCLLIFNGA